LRVSQAGHLGRRTSRLLPLCPPPAPTHQGSTNHQSSPPPAPSPNRPKGTPLLGQGCHSHSHGHRHGRSRTWSPTTGPMRQAVAGHNSCTPAAQCPTQRTCDWVPGLGVRGPGLPPKQPGLPPKQQTRGRINLPFHPLPTRAAATSQPTSILGMHRPRRQHPCPPPSACLACLPRGRSRRLTCTRSSLARVRTTQQSVHLQ
jgi:hypothetical protein